MSKKFALLLVALLVVSALLVACSTKSRDAGEDYVNALLKGDDQKALGLACASFQDQTQVLLDWYREQNVHQKSIDLKFDIGKANNQKEIIATGSYDYGDPDLPRQWVLSEKKNTRIVLDMAKVNGDWCVTDKSVFEGSPLQTDMSGGENPTESSGE